MFELEAFLFVFLAFLDEFVEHVFEVGLPASDFGDHFCLFLFKGLDLVIEHVPEVLQCGLFIPGIFACLFFRLNDLQPFQELVLHLQYFLIGFQVFEPDVIVLLEQFLESFLLLFVLFLEFSELLGQFLVSLLQLLVDCSDLGDFLLLEPDFLLDFLLILFFLDVEFSHKVLRVLLALVEEVTVLDLQFVALFIELELGLLHEFLVFCLDVLNFVGMFLFKDLNLISDSVVALQFVVDLFLVVLLELADFLIITLLLSLEFLSQLIVLLGAVLDVGILNFLVGL